LRQQAQQIVEYNAAQTPTPELRASFLALPELLRFLSQSMDDKRPTTAPIIMMSQNRQAAKDRAIADIHQMLVNLRTEAQMPPDN